MKGTRFMNRNMHFQIVFLAASILLAGVVFLGCSKSGRQTANQPGIPAVEPDSGNGAQGSLKPKPSSPLAGTEWRLAEIQSMDDFVGRIVPPDSSLYIMRLNSDVTVNMLLNCDNATGN
jgi:hypothetical protein